MSKSFSARFKALAALGLAAVLLSGCEFVGLLTARDKPHEQAAKADPAAPSASEDASAASPSAEPGLARQQWRASDPAARKVTGNLTASLENVRSGPLALAFANGVTLRLENLGRTSAQTPTAPGGPSFGQQLGANADASISLYRVVQEDVERVAPEGGLCRREPTTYVAIAEYVDGSGGWTFRTGAFAGDEPGPNAKADPRFCGAYVYDMGP